MKYIFLLIFVGLTNLSMAAKVTAWDSNNLTNGDIDLSKGNPEVTYNFSREQIGGEWENVQMELTFYVVYNNIEIDVSDIVINSADFFLTGGAYANGKRTIPGLSQYVGGVLRAKYRTYGTSSWGPWINVSSKALSIDNYGSVSSIVNGVFVNNTTSGEVSIMFEGKLRHIQNYPTLVTIFNVAIPSELRDFSTAQLSSVPKGPAIGSNTALVRIASGSAVYFREGNVLRHINSWPIFQKYKFRYENIQNLPSLPASYSIGTPIYN